MADSAAFERSCEVLERETPLDRLEARGTIRLTLKAAGLESRSVSAEQMIVVIDKLLGPELDSRGIDDAARVCASLAEALTDVESAETTEDPEAIFARLGGT